MTQDVFPKVPFGIGMASTQGSPPFPVLVFDDGAAVALHSVRGLATELGLTIPTDSVFALLQDWDRHFPALAALVQALAYDDRATGHRGQFAPEDLFQAERLVPEARQMFRIADEGAITLPVSAQTGAYASLYLDERATEAVPAFAVAAVIGRMCRNAQPEEAAAAIAGWTLAIELVRPGTSPLKAHGGPGSMILGPTILPAPFATDFGTGAYRFAAMGNVLSQGTVADWWHGAAERVAALSQDVLLLPGDVVVLAKRPEDSAPTAGAVDMLEAAAPGFGQIKVSLK